jgi:hypothetical protein
MNYRREVGKPGKLSVLHWLALHSSTSNRPAWITSLVKAFATAVYKPRGNVHIHPLNQPLLN